MSAARRVVFIHVMKTGGISLSRLMRSLHEADRSYPPLGLRESVQLKMNVGPLDALGDGRDEYDFFTLHMPAWVAVDLLGDLTAVTVLREPVERTISHLHHIERMNGEDRSVDELYDDPGIHDRLVNYQTRLLSMQRSDHAADADPDRRLLTPQERQQFRREAAVYFATTLATAEPLAPDALDVARSNLEHFAVVGTTDDLAGTVSELGRVLGRDLPDVRKRNVNPAPSTVSDALRARIVRENQIDTELYEHVVAQRAGR